MNTETKNPPFAYAIKEALRRDMATCGKTTPEHYCPRTACMYCAYFNHEHAVEINKTCPLREIKEKSMQAGYDEIVSDLAGHPAKMIYIPVRKDGYLVDTKSIVADWRCPACGAIMGEPKLSRFCEDGEFYYVHTWDSPCGHVVKYSELVIDSDGVGDDYETTRHLIKEVSAQ